LARSVSHFDLFCTKNQCVRRGNPIALQRRPRWFQKSKEHPDGPRTTFVLSGRIESSNVQQLKLNLAEIETERPPPLAIACRHEDRPLSVMAGGMLVAGSSRSDSPTEIQNLRLRVAASQATIALHEAERDS